jgi:hypothetical protein
MAGKPTATRNAAPICRDATFPLAGRPTLLRIVIGDWGKEDKEFCKAERLPTPQSRSGDGV